MSAAQCVCPHCGKSIAVVDSRSTRALAVTVSRIAGIGIARTRHAPEIEIIRRAAAAFGTTPTLILSREKLRTVALARKVAIYTIRRELGRSFPEIGRIFGHADHTSAMVAYRSVVGMLSNIVDGEPLSRLVDRIASGEGFDDVEAEPPVQARAV